jgi:prepilin-type N-terminal cleavage/methylation domain-containing protein
MLKSIRKSRQSGFTLVELGIVLALIGIGLFFAISKMQDTSSTSKAQNAASDTSSTITNIRRFYGTAAIFPAAGVSSAAMLGNNLVPERWIDRTGKDVVLIGPFGTAPTVVQADSGKQALMTFTNVPRNVCGEMVRLVSDGVNVITIGAVTVKAAGGLLDINSLGTECGKTAVVSVGFQFTKV